jgi:septum formation protein
MIIEKLDRFRIILASRSPRRQQLLGQMGIKFEVVQHEFDETYPSELKGEGIARFISKNKSDSLRGELNKDEICITADTIVWCDNAVLGKPRDPGEAFSMLVKISGKTHEVITAVTIVSKEKEVTFADSTKVTFEKLSKEEIEFYVGHFKPYDKAGAYGIQEWIGIIACSRIEGSFFNVVGLPVQKLYIELKKFIEP